MLYILYTSYLLSITMLLPDIRLSLEEVGTAHFSSIPLFVEFAAPLRSHRQQNRPWRLWSMTFAVMLSRSLHSLASSLASLFSPEYAKELAACASFLKTATINRSCFRVESQTSAWSTQDEYLASSLLCYLEALTPLSSLHSRSKSSAPTRIVLLVSRVYRSPQARSLYEHPHQLEVWRFTFD